MIFRNNTGVVVAVLKNGTLKKKVDSRVHKLNFINGYAVDVDILKAAEQAGCNRIEVEEADTGRLMSVSYENFLNFSTHIDLGHGEQVGLSLRYWTEESKGQGALFDGK